MMIDCDKGMILALLRNWHPNRLQPKGVRLATLRPQLIERQKGVCAGPLCNKDSKQLSDDGKATHVDHVVTVKELLDKVLQGELVFEDAYRQLWAESNLRAICRSCNYARKPH
jgi:5-methylcytosine-specific restriction endonuclease McrA